jgi:Flp pilus assembly protein TadD
MVDMRKRFAALALAATAFLAGAAGAQDVPSRLPDASPEASPPDPSPPSDSRLDALMAELAAPETANWQGVEAEIIRAWSQSGSDAMDLLLQRGRDAIEAEDYMAAVEHLTALTDHAPDFAEGWNTRASAFFLMGEFSLALSDIGRTLALNPRHFGALSGLGIILDEMGQDGLALEALRASAALNPHREEQAQAIERLERTLGGAEL